MASLDQQLLYVNEAKICVEAAGNEKNLRACKSSFRNKMRDFREKKLEKIHAVKKLKK